MDNEELIKHENNDYDELLKKMNAFLSSADGSTFNICAQLYEIIKYGDVKIQPRLFEQAIILYEDVESDESINVPVSPFEIQKTALKEQYGNLVNSFIAFFVQQKYSCEDFYNYMWNTLQDNVFFPDKAAKVFAFYYVLIDRRVPYFELSQGYLMTNESFKLLYRKSANELHKVRYILSTEMKQKTERASLVLKELGIDIPDSAAPVEVVTEYEKKVMIMVEVLKNRRESNAQSFDEILSKLQEQISE